jgi:hypothetical protein
MCNSTSVYPPTIDCCLGECDLCGNDEKLRSKIEYLFDENFVDEITFKRWTHTDRSNLETVVKKVDDFLDDFIKSLKLYQQHAFITQAQ